MRIPLAGSLLFICFLPSATFIGQLTQPSGMG